MTVRTGLVLTIASIAAGVLNYLFQVHAVGALERPAFGLLSAWLAEVMLVSSVGSLVQYVSLDARVERLSAWLTPAGVVSLVLTALLAVAGGRVPLLALGAISVAGAMVLHGVIGQLQARLRLGIVASAVLVAAAARFALPFAVSFYVAHAASALIGVTTAALLLRIRGDGAAGDRGAPDAAAPRPRWRLGRPLLLAVSIVLLPQIDILVLARLADPSTLGAYARVALAARIVFFGGAAVLQTVLPHQLHAAERGEPVPPFVAHVQRWLALVFIVGAVALAAIAKLALRPVGDERTWLFGSCLAAALLVALLGHVQRFAARQRVLAAAGCLAGVVVASAIAAGVSALSRPPDVTRFVLVSLAGDAIVLAIAAGLQSMHSRIERPEVASRR